MFKKLNIAAFFVISISQIANCSESPNRKQLGDRLQAWRGATSTATQQQQSSSPRNKVTVAPQDRQAADTWMAERMQTPSPTKNSQEIPIPAPKSASQGQTQHAPPSYLAAIASGAVQQDGAKTNSTQG